MLAMSKQIFNEGDYKIRYTSTVSKKFYDGKWREERINIDEQKVLFLTTSRLFSLYKQVSMREGE
jgi:hypothetical protein